MFVLLMTIVINNKMITIRILRIFMRFFSILAASTAFVIAVSMSSPVLAEDESATEANGEADHILVVGHRAEDRAPGATSLVSQTDLENSRVFNVNEALRKVPGLVVRDEEGIGLRPNIGVRGLQPTRSTKILLLEDGIPLTYGPYGDNATYYHPPIDRFASIEVLKGSGQILYGPHTVGAVINYVTPDVPDTLAGRFKAAIGNRDYYDVTASIGGPLGADTGANLMVTRKESDGSRDNIHSNVTDANLKIQLQAGDAHMLTFRASVYDENSQQTYGGSTLAEYQFDPRYNPFVNDFFNTRRYGLSLTHGWDLNTHLTLKTSAYYSYFDRNWWRQSSNSTQRPNDASDPACGAPVIQSNGVASMPNLSTTCGNEGRLRRYAVYGVEPRLTWIPEWGRVDAGVRVQHETQNRRQFNADTPDGRTPGSGPNAGVREASGRSITAYSGFLQARFDIGQLSITPGARVENIHYERLDRLTGLGGNTSITEFIPGIGVSWIPWDNATLFGGVHRGFSPPGVADIITAAGGTLNLDAEKSWNYELGARVQPTQGTHVELTAFRLDFANQVIPGSIAAGNPAGAVNAGKSLHQGLEFLATADTRDMGLTRGWAMNGRVAWTWLADAKFAADRCEVVLGSPQRAPCDAGEANVRGNRLPYAPEHTLSATLGLSKGPVHIEAEYVYVSSQYGDNINTVEISANGQRGRLPGFGIWNTALNYDLSDKFTLFATIKNIGNKTYIVDLIRGILPGSPRLVQGGVAVKF
jgi:Fe(3+) dicitrate transport protein